MFLTKKIKWIVVVLLTGALSSIIFTPKNYIRQLNPLYNVETEKIFAEKDYKNLNNILDIKNSNSYKVDGQLLKYLANNMHDTLYPGVVNYTLYMTTLLGLKPLSGIRPLRPDFGPVLNDVSSFRYPIQVPPCKRIEVTGRPTIFVAIVSAPSYFDRRISVRQTWLAHFQNQKINGSQMTLVGYGFVIGLVKDDKIQMQIEKENKKYGDILQIDIIDDYFNLTLKSVSIVNWLNKYCQQVDFVLKADDDTFVNVRNLIVTMNALNPYERAIYGGKSDCIPKRGSPHPPKKINK